MKKGGNAKLSFIIPFPMNTLISSSFRIFINIPTNGPFFLDSFHPLVNIHFIFLPD